jgi:hypothetical protein
MPSISYRKRNDSAGFGCGKYVASVANRPVLEQSDAIQTTMFLRGNPRKTGASFVKSQFATLTGVK